MKKSFTQRALHSLVSGTVFGLALMVTISVVAYAQGNAQPIFQSMLEGMLVNPNPATTDWQVVNARDADHALSANSADIATLANTVKPDALKQYVMTNCKVNLKYENTGWLSEDQIGSNGCPDNGVIFSVYTVNGEGGGGNPSGSRCRKITTEIVCS